MNVVIVVNKLTRGGAERVAALWANGFSKLNNNVTLVLTGRVMTHTYPVLQSVIIKEIGLRNKYLNYIWRKLFGNFLIKKYINESCPDVVISVLPSYGPILLNIRGNRKYKIVGTDHNSYERPEGAEMSNEQRYFKFEFNKKFDIITVLTQADKDIIGNKLKNVWVLPNPLGLSPASEVPPKKKVILAAGSLDAWHYKGFDILVKAWARIADKASGWKLQIAGGSRKDGLKFLKDLCAEKDVTDSVEFLGYREDITPYYRDASIFVLSSRYEAFGLVLIEAMSQGCACIACDYKGRQSEIITTKEEGLVCNPDDVSSLSDALYKMISDDSYREKTQSNAIKRSKAYSLDNIMERWYQILGLDKNRKNI